MSSISPIEQIAKTSAAAPSQPPPLRLAAGILTLLRFSAAALAVLMVLFFLVSTKGRLHYPYDSFDTGSVVILQRILHGLPIYSAPGIDYTPYLYTPLFYYASAAMAKITGAGFIALRSVSVLSTLGCFAVIYALVFAEVRRHLAALIAVGCFASCYPVVLEWFNVGRADMLCLLFVLCALYATRWMNPAFAALLWVCAFQTKQGVLPVAVLALAYDWQRPRRLLLGLATFATLLLGSIAWLNHLTQHWYSFYIFGVVGGFGFDKHLLPRILPSDLLAQYGIALLVIIAAFLLTPPRLRGRAASFYAVTVVGMIVFSCYIRAHRGAGTNALLPAFAWISVLLGIAIARLSHLLESRRTPIANACLAILFTALSVQIAQHIYSPTEFSPTPKQLAGRQAFEDQIRAIPGDVLVFAFPEAGMIADKPVHAHQDASGGVIDAKNQLQGDRLIQAYADWIHSGELSGIALDRTAEEFLTSPRSWMPRDFLSYYPLLIHAKGREDAAFGTQPRWIYLPCRQVNIARTLDPEADLTPCLKP